MRVHCSQDLAASQSKEVQLTQNVHVLGARIDLMQQEDAQVTEEVEEDNEDEQGDEQFEKDNEDEQFEQDDEVQMNAPAVSDDATAAELQAALEASEIELKRVQEVRSQLNTQKEERAQQVKEEVFVQCVNIVLCVQAMSDKGRWLSHQVNVLSINVGCADGADGLSRLDCAQSFNNSNLANLSQQEVNDAKAAGTAEFGRIILSKASSAQRALELMSKMQEQKKSPAASLACNLQCLDAIM